MIERVQRFALLAAYQLSITLGIVLLPVALAFRQVGVVLPIHRFIDRVGEAYEGTAEGTR
ncbi:MAG: hypothetical protein ACI9PP_000961 [Halobacteriales archaeon]|jgi:hypothetical protein